VESEALPLRARRAREHLLATSLERHGLLIAVVCIYALVLTMRLTAQISQDTWLELVAGREIVRHGIPVHDTLTSWTLGRRWVDEQWLAQLLAYALYRAGGLTLLAFAHVASVCGSVVLALRTAGKLGAGARARAWLLTAAAGPVMLNAANVRTQSFVYPLFVLVLSLLVVDARRPSRRVFLVPPLLVLWANLHGSVVVAAALAVLAAACGAPRGPLRSLLLAAGAAAAPLATPWGFATVDYYQATLLNPLFKQVVTEWRPTTLQLLTVPLYVAAAATIWLVAQQRRRLSAFEVAAPLALVALSFSAVRNGVWLGFGLIVLLARPLAVALGARELARPRLNVLIATAAVAVLAVRAVGVAAGGERRFERGFPSGAAAAIAQAATRDTRAVVFSNERWADWLLFRVPQLRGRVAYDARLELLDEKQLLSVYVWRNELGARWQRVPGKASLIVLDLAYEQPLARVLAREHVHVLYRDRRIVVFSRSR
jgi:hypothetical protein